jgi:hypothetical protein
MKKRENLALFFWLGCILVACQLASNGRLPTPITTLPTAAATALPAPTFIITATGRPSPLPPPSLTSPATAAATPTTTPTATFIPSPLPSPTATPLFERLVIGNSVDNNPIEAIRLADGPRWFVLLGALHGGHECNTSDMLNRLVARFQEEPTLLPADLTLFVAPQLNPDGCQLGTRANANGVDLNRNFHTPNWTADAQGPAGLLPGSGGREPFSEPETRALRDWLLALGEQVPAGPIIVISYHSVVPQTGLAQPGYHQEGQPDPQAEQVARTYAGATGYLYSPVWIGAYHITGEFIHWALPNGLIAIDVELPDTGPADSIPPGWNESHLETNLRGLLAVMAAPPTVTPEPTEEQP